jgi:hypothetical protein
MSRALGLILLLCGLLAVGFARTTPIGGAPDEGAHLEYVRVLVEEHRLPTLNMAEHRTSFADPGYESHQPPLYYAAAVPFYAVGKAVAGPTGAAQACRALSILLGLVGVALVWLIAREVVPERPGVWIAAAGLAAFLPMRLAVIASISNDALAEVTASLSLLLMVRAMRGHWGPRPALYLGLALGAALLSKQSHVALLPPALLALFLASFYPGALKQEGAPPEDRRQKAVPNAQRPTPNTQHPTPNTQHPTPNTQHPTPNAPPPARLFFATGAITAAAILGLAGWWFIRNTVIYGDPMAYKAFTWYFADTTLWCSPLDARGAPTAPDFCHNGFSFTQYLQKKVFPTTFASFWGAFGHMDPKEPEKWFLGAYRLPGYAWGYPPRSWAYEGLFWATVASCLGGLLYGVRARLAPKAPAEGAPVEPPVASVLALYGLFVFATFLRFNTEYFQAQGRYLFPAMACIGLGLAGGWLEWARFVAGLLFRRRAPEVTAAISRKWECGLAWLITAAMLALSVYALFGVVTPAFHPPPTTSASSLVPVGVPL